MTKARDLADIISGGFTVADLPTLTASEIPNLDASKIVSGDISAARLSLATETKPVVSSVSPSAITNDAQNIVITGTDFTAIPRVDIINTATGIWYSVNTVTHNSSTSLTVNLALAVDAGTYRIRVENPDGLAGLSGANFLTVSDAPTWTTGAGSLGTVAGNTNGAVATVSASGDTIVYSETTNVLTNASLANCSLNSSTGAITSTDFDGSSTSARTHTFTIRATDAQGQTADREFTLTSSYSISAYYLMVAGGGAGGSGSSNGGMGGGGGGAGGFRTNYGSTAITFTPTTQYTITVGSGGAGSGFDVDSDSSDDGGDTSISGSGLTTILTNGGGAGGSGGNSSSQTGRTGGSGGGAGAGRSSAGGSGNEGNFSPSEGNNGGQGDDGSQPFSGGGGGGSSQAGHHGVNQHGHGGNGTANSITGSSITYAGGGGGGTWSDSSLSGQASGGSGGGGHGAPKATSSSGQAGTNGLGGAGGGGGENGSGATGGSGVFILRVATSDYSGTTTGSPTVTTDGSNTIVKWTSNGTYTA